MELIDFALPVGWIALGALVFWAAQRLLRDRGSERIVTTLERQQQELDQRLERTSAQLEERLLKELQRRDRSAAKDLETRLVRLLPPEPRATEDDAAARLHARRRRVAPELFAAVRDLHRATGDLVDELHGWPAEVDPPDLWEAVDTARSRLHAVFARTRIHLPTTVDTLIAEYRRVVTECLRSQRHSEQLADGRPQAARFAADRAKELLRAADEHFRRIEDDLRGIVEDLDTPPGDRTRSTAPEPVADSAATADAGIRPTNRPTITFESDLLDRSDDEEEDRTPHEGGGPAADGGPEDTMRPRD